MACSTLASILAIRQLLFVNVEEQAEKSLVQEVEEFRRLAKGRNPSTGQPFGDDIAAIFKVFLSRNVPHDDEFFLTLLNGKLYKSSPRALPNPIRSDSELVKYWAQLKQPEQGQKLTSAGTILYLVEPVIITGKTRGVFVLAHFSQGELEEVNDAVAIVNKVASAILIVASAIAWVVAGRVLAPLRLLTNTSRSITESDLTKRIPVQGSDEIAELTITFNEMLDRLQFAFASQRDFINDASHELQTPITIIQGHLEVLGNYPDERCENLRQTLAIVTDELARMSRFVDDLLLLAKAEQPDFLLLETVEIGSLTEELYTKARALAPRNWHLDTKASVCIVADRQRLTQAIMNLAQNATQHTKEGDIIALGSELSGTNARLWVCDTGEGITLAEQQRIFERFARGSSGRRRSKGAGLGLSIVKAIALAHGGRVELFSRPGGGSTFSIVIPIEPPLEVLSYEPDSNC
jgi:signal transduction histidine kinase